MIRSKVLGTHRNIYDPIGNIGKQHIISVPGYKTLGSQPLLGVCSLRAAQGSDRVKNNGTNPTQTPTSKYRGKSHESVCDYRHLLQNQDNLSKTPKITRH